MSDELELLRLFITLLTGAAGGATIAVLIMIAIWDEK